MKRNLFAALTLAFAVVVAACGSIFLDGKVCELSPRGDGDDRIRLYGIAEPPCASTGRDRAGLVQA
ncbi:MAG: hypothetical protein ACI4NV_06470 [Thermoguttaceae bacterium]